MDFKRSSKFQPTGDQPEAIEQLAQGVSRGMKEQTLLGVTGSGKTFRSEEHTSELQSQR